MITGPPDSWIQSHANGMCCDDAGACHQCDEELDSGRCECLRCDDCGEYLDEYDAIEVTVENIQTKELVKIKVCEGCAEKRGMNL